MLRSEAELLQAEGKVWILPITYLAVISVLSGLLFVSAGASSSPVLGMGWGIFLAAVALGALKIEGISPRGVLPSVRTVLPVTAVLVVFWGVYNLVVVGLAVGGVAGFEGTGSRAATHPLLYLAAMLSSLLFTALPEELAFRSYFQQKLITIAGGNTRKSVVVGVAITALLFAGFHLPRWFLASGHGTSGGLIVHLFGLTLAGVTYGIVYELTGNLWLVGLLHATMNQPPVLVAMSLPSDLHFVVGLIEYLGIIVTVYLAVRATEREGTKSVWFRRAVAS